MKTLALALLTIALLAATPAMAQPTLGADCPSGTTLVGSDKAGRLVMSASPDSGICTLEGFPAHDRACSATNETSGGGYAQALGTQATTTTVAINFLSSATPGDVVSYQCSTF